MKQRFRQGGRFMQALERVRTVSAGAWAAKIRIMRIWIRFRLMDCSNQEKQ
jgi:hypothetical protein